MAPNQVACVAEKTRNKFLVGTTDHSDRADIVRMLTENHLIYGKTQVKKTQIIVKNKFLLWIRIIASDRADHSGTSSKPTISNAYRRTSTYTFTIIVIVIHNIVLYSRCTKVCYLFFLEEIWYFVLFLNLWLIMLSTKHNEFLLKDYGITVSKRSALFWKTSLVINTQQYLE